MPRPDDACAGVLAVLVSCAYRRRASPFETSCSLCCKWPAAKACRHLAVTRGRKRGGWPSHGARPPGNTGGYDRHLGVHKDHPALGLVERGFISVGWDELGDIKAVATDKDTLKLLIAGTYPDAKPGAIPVWAGVLYRFAFDMTPGDLAIYPYKADSTLNFARITGRLLAAKARRRAVRALCL
jgi:hypothetical protein